MLRETENKILNYLNTWKQVDGSLTGLVELYGDLLKVQVQAREKIAIPHFTLTPQEVARKLRQGTPLLLFGDIAWDWTLLGEVFRKVVAVIQEYSADDPEELAKLEDIVAQGSLLQQAVKAWYEGSLPLADTVAPGINERLLTGMIQATLYPFLSAYAEALSVSLSMESWRRGYCPVCGGRPDLAFLDKDKGARRLICCRCDTQWLFQRLQCPYCNTDDQQALSYLSEERGLYRLYLCEKCHNYLKAVDLRKTQAEVLLPLERVVTVDMDRQGLEAGYQPGWSTLPAHSPR